MLHALLLSVHGAGAVIPSVHDWFALQCRSSSVRSNLVARLCNPTRCGCGVVKESAVAAMYSCPSPT